MSAPVVDTGAVVERAALVRALTLAFSVAPKNGAKVCLRYAHVRVAGNGETLLVEGRTMEHGVESEVPMSGSVAPLLFPREALAWLKLAKGATTVRISAGRENRVDLACGDARATFSGWEPAEYPVWASVRETWSASVAPADLATMLRRAEHAATREESRYAIAGVLLEGRAGELVAVATDSRRMALTRCSAAVTGEWRGILPLPTVATVLRATKGASGQVTVVADAVHVRVHVGDITVTSRMLDQGFPEYRSVVPKSAPIRFSVDRADLLAAVRLAGAASTGDMPLVALRACGEDLAVCGSDQADGGAIPTRKASGVPDDGTMLRFNPRYLADALALGDSLDATVHWTDSSCPMLVEMGSEYRYVLMPISD